MTLSERWQKAVRDNGTNWKLWWIDIRFGIEEWILKKTATWRIKKSKFLILEGEHYLNDHRGDYKSNWEDVTVLDQWGFWVPYGFGICSKDAWEEENKFNRELGHPEEPWQDVAGDESWLTYYTKDQYLEAKHYFELGRKHLKKKLGKELYKKDLHLKLKAVCQEFLDEEMMREAEWIKAGKPPFKINFTDRAKDDFKGILGEEGAKELFDEHEKRNKEIDVENQHKLDEEKKRREDDEKRGEN
ncbi:MAG: hypothetical protein V3U54_07820 [Thermodesulfobacteriota bacterium]